MQGAFRIGAYLNLKSRRTVRSFGVAAEHSLVWPEAVAGIDLTTAPGNKADGSTDDGVKAAATSSMFAMTGIEGWYNPRRYCYLPPDPYRTWADVVKAHALRLTAAGG